MLCEEGFMNGYQRDAQDDTLSWVWCAHSCHTSFNIRATLEVIIINRLFIGVKDRKEEKAEGLYLGLSLSINHVNKNKIASNLNFEKAGLGLCLAEDQSICPVEKEGKESMTLWWIHVLQHQVRLPWAKHPAQGGETHSCRAEIGLLAKSVPSLPSVHCHPSLRGVRHKATRPDPWQNCGCFCCRWPCPGLGPWYCTKGGQYWPFCEQYTTNTILDL